MGVPTWRGDGSLGSISGIGPVVVLQWGSREYDWESCRGVTMRVPCVPAWRSFLERAVCWHVTGAIPRVGRVARECSHKIQFESID